MLLVFFVTREFCSDFRCFKQTSAKKWNFRNFRTNCLSAHHWIFVYDLKKFIVTYLPNRQWLEKFLLFIFLYVCVWRDRGRANYSIYLKVCTIFYKLCEISCIVFSVHFQNNIYTGMHKSISMLYDLCREIL